MHEMDSTGLTKRDLIDLMVEVEDVVKIMNSCKKDEIDRLLKAVNDYWMIFRNSVQNTKDKKESFWRAVFNYMYQVFLSVHVIGKQEPFPTVYYQKLAHVRKMDNILEQIDMMHIWTNEVWLLITNNQQIINCPDNIKINLTMLTSYLKY